MLSPLAVRQLASFATALLPQPSFACHLATGADHCQGCRQLLYCHEPAYRIGLCLLLFDALELHLAIFSLFRLQIHMSLEREEALLWVETLSAVVHRRPKEHYNFHHPGAYPDLAVAQLASSTFHGPLCLLCQHFQVSFTHHGVA